MYKLVLSSSMREQVNELTPLEKLPPRLTKPKSVAAGIPGVLASLSHSMDNNLISSIYYGLKDTLFLTYEWIKGFVKLTLPKII